MANRLLSVLDWYSRGETINSLIDSEFARNWLGPLVTTALTGATGLAQGLPIMWVMVGSSIVFMTVTIAMVASIFLRESLKTSWSPKFSSIGI